MESVESQIAEWRAYVAKAPGVNGRDVDELEDHLRHQIAERREPHSRGGVPYRRETAGDVDGLSREFAREHSGRLWKQLLSSGDDEPARASSGWLGAFAFAAAAAVAIQVGRIAADFPDEEPTWFARNLSLFVLPFLAGYFARRRQLGTPALGADGGAVRARRDRGQPLPVGRGLGHRGPRRTQPAGRALVRGRLPVHGRHRRSHERRMDFVRFTGEWFIYYVLIALGGGVLMGLTAGILEPAGVDVERDRRVGAASGAAGAVIVAAWLVESKQRVVRTWRRCSRCSSRRCSQ